MKRLLGVAMTAMLLTGCMAPDNDKIIAETKKCYAAGLDAVSLVRGITCIPPSNDGPSIVLSVVQLQHKVQQLEERAAQLEKL